MGPAQRSQSHILTDSDPRYWFLMFIYYSVCIVFDSKGSAVAQLVKRTAPDQEVVGAIPSGASLTGWVGVSIMWPSETGQGHHALSLCGRS